MKFIYWLAAFILVLQSCAGGKQSSPNANDADSYEYLQLWGISFAKDSPERADSIVKSKGYSLENVFGTTTVYKGTFQGYDSKIALYKGVVDSTSNKVVTTAGTFFVLAKDSERDLLNQTFDKLKQQISDSHPTFEFSSQKNECLGGPTDYEFSLKKGAKTIHSHIGNCTCMADSINIIVDGLCILINYGYEYMPSKEKKEPNLTDF